MNSSTHKIPVFILSGFLGSGKTTFLKQWLAQEADRDTAVLVNEFGEVGLDHLILQEVNPETVLLPSGCLCCQIRGELKDALFSLLEQLNQKELPPFKKVILETTGLADPGPIVSTLLHDKLLQHHFICGGVVTVVDAQNYRQQAEAYPEWIKQAAAADTILLSKQDCVDRQQHEAALAYLKNINSMAAFYATKDFQALKDTVFTVKTDSRPKRAHFFKLDTQENLLTVQQANRSNNHPATKTCVLEWDKSLNWSAFSIWLSLLLYRYGDKILRLKGVLVTDDGVSIAVHGVQRNLYPPEHIEQSEFDRTKLVLITHNFDIEKLRESFYSFMHKYG